MNVLDKDGLVKEISIKELDTLIKEFGELIRYSGYSNSLDREDDIVDIQDGRCNILYVRSYLVKYIPGFLDVKEFREENFYVFESVETHLVPVILKYNDKIYCITPDSWRPREKDEWELLEISKKRNQTLEEQIKTLQDKIAHLETEDSKAQGKLMVPMISDSINWFDWKVGKVKQDYRGMQIYLLPKNAKTNIYETEDDE
jgi:hypothetical protein